MRSGSHVQLAALRNRDLELQTSSPFSDHGSAERSTACFRHKNVLVLLGFQKFPFFVSPCIYEGCCDTFFTHSVKQQMCVNRSILSREWLVNDVRNIGVTYACETRTNTGKC